MTVKKEESINIVCGDYHNDCEKICQNNFDFYDTCTNDILEVRVLTNYNSCKHGLNIHQKLVLNPRIDSAAKITIDLGMDYLSPKKLRELADQIEKDIEFSRRVMLEKQKSR